MTIHRSLEPQRDAGGNGRHGNAVQGQDGDETLTCRDCNREFAFTICEQEFYKEKGCKNRPGRCKNCNADSTRGKHSTVARDQAAGRGDNQSRNKVLKAANAAVPAK